MVRLSFLAVVFLLCVVSSYARTDVDVQAICKQADNPSFCLTLLNSKPGGPGKNLVDLEAYIFGVLRNDLSNSVALLKKLIAQSGGDPKKERYYKICLQYFGEDEGALGQIYVGLLQLKMGDYLGVNVHMSAILTFVNDCLTDEDAPPKDTSMFPKDADLVNQVAKIGLLISTILREK
jgi:pectinesterase inhibitor-like protein